MEHNCSSADACGYFHIVIIRATNFLVKMPHRASVVQPQGRLSDLMESLWCIRALTTAGIKFFTFSGNNCPIFTFIQVTVIIIF